MKPESELDSLYIASLIILCFFVFFLAISFAVIVPVDHARREKERKHRSNKHKKHKQELRSGYGNGNGNSFYSVPKPLNLNTFPQPLYGFQAYPIS